MPGRIDAFELWCLRRLLRMPWTARRSNQSVLKEINPEYSLEWLMLKLKLQYFGHTIRRANSLEKTLILVKDWRHEEKEGTEGEIVGWHHWYNGHEFEQTARDNEIQGNLECCSPWGQKELNRTEWLNKNSDLYENISLCTLIAYSFYVVYSLWPHW